MRKISIAAFIAVIMMMISGCPPTRVITQADLCHKDLYEACKGCSPYFEKLRIVSNKLNDTMITEMKSCADVAAKLSVSGKTPFDLSFKGCVNPSVVLDKDTKDALIKEIGNALVPESQYNKWLECYSGVVGRKPVVVILDQRNDDLTYCQDTRKINASNAFDIQNLIKDLPISLIPLSTYLGWQNEQQVINLEPKLIVVHASAFYKKTQELEGNNRLILFLDSLKGTGIKILVYTRGLPGQPDERMRKQWEDLLSKIKDPEMKKNAELFTMPKGYESCFTDPDVGVPFKNKIKDMLSLK